MNKASQQRNRREFLKQTTQAGVLALGATGPRRWSTAGESNAAATIQIGILLGTFGSGTLEARVDAVMACSLDCVQVSLDCAGVPSTNLVRAGMAEEPWKMIAPAGGMRL